MAIKIVDQDTLSEGQLGLALDHWPTPKEKIELEAWVRQNEFCKFIKLDPYYELMFDGEIGNPCIQVLKDAPAFVKTMCLLRWS